MKAPINIENAKSVEAISVAGNNFIRYENDTDREKRTYAVHKFYLESVKAFLSSLKISIEYDNVDVIRRLADINKGNALATD